MRRTLGTLVELKWLTNTIIIKNKAEASASVFFILNYHMLQLNMKKSVF